MGSTRPNLIQAGWVRALSSALVFGTFDTPNTKTDPHEMC